MGFQDKLRNEIKKNILNDRGIIAVILFGSYNSSEAYRDIDICLVLDKKYPNLLMSRKRLRYSSLFSGKYDVQIFQQLPLYIQKRILNEGKIAICKDEDKLYEVAFEAIKEFEYYKKIYYGYLESMEQE